MDLPNNLFLYLLLLIALAIGFLLGRRERRPTRTQAHVIKDYYQGLNFLLGERPELGVDRFIQAMEVNDESIDVHLALASVVRRRGEVDKAIRIHQNLIASPALSSANRQLVEYELARDYHTAGLLDRAEALLIQIVDRKDAQEKAATRLLVEVYEAERDWQKAIDRGQRLAQEDRALANRVSHFHCELGEAALERGELHAARDEAFTAIRVDGDNPRAHWLAASVESAQKKYKSVIKRLGRVVQLKPDLASAIRPLYARACENLGADSEYLAFLEADLANQPTVESLQAMFAIRRQRGFATPEIEAETIDRLIGQLETGDGPVDMSYLLALMELADDDNRPKIEKHLRTAADALRGHRCGACGFTAQTHLWHCPTCKAWGSFSGSAV